MTDAGGFDLSALLEQAQAMQEQMSVAQEEQAQQEVTGTAASGRVAVTMTGAGEFRSVKIAPDVVDPDDVEMLEDLVLAALRDAAGQVMELQQNAMGDLDLGGLEGGLGGLLGGS